MNGESNAEPKYIIPETSHHDYYRILSIRTNCHLTQDTHSPTLLPSDKMHSLFRVSIYLSTSNGKYNPTANTKLPQTFSNSSALTDNQVFVLVFYNPPPYSSKHTQTDTHDTKNAHTRKRKNTMSGSGKGLLGLWLYRSGEQEWAVKEGSPLHKKRDLLVCRVVHSR